MMKMMMICNPYQKTIQYLWYDDSKGKYIDLAEQSDFHSELTNTKFTRDVTLQMRADEIVRIIDDLDPSDEGVDVHFIGTQDDFDDLKRVVELFYANKRIHCIKEQSYFLDAEYALSQIEERFSKVEDILSGYQEMELYDLLCSFRDTMKPELAICIMGLYSAGKSAFINSLVGCELLPSASDPTTAKVCRIRCRNSYRVEISVDDVRYTVSYDKNEPEISGEEGYDESVTDILRNHVQEGDDRIAHMYYLLKFLNTSMPFGEEHPDSDMIDVFIPFINSKLPTDRFDFVIYDTPGSNSASNATHFAVLNEALSSQTNALPIILTTPDTMDDVNNEKLLKLIHDNENKLDTTNGLIVINKADEKARRTLEEKKDTIDRLKLSKWKSTRIFFVSALLGLAAKKDDPHDKTKWFDSDSYEIYMRNNELYESNERQLYTYNIVDKSRIQHFDYSEDDGINVLLHYNSGLASIELELANYAERYSLYIKCREAIQYLHRAATICEICITSIKEKQTEKLASATKRYEGKKDLISGELNIQRKSVVKTAYDSFREELNKKYEEFKTKFHIETSVMERFSSFFGKGSSYIHSDFQKKWNELQKEAKAAGEQDDKVALKKMQEYITEQFNMLLNYASTALNLDLDSFWEDRTSVFKKIIRSIIMESAVLTDEQKTILDDVVLNVNSMAQQRVEFDLREHQGIKMGIIPFVPIGKESYNNTGCCRNFLAEFDKQVQSRMKEAIEQNVDTYDAWCENIIKVIIEKIGTFNEELREAEEEITKLQEEVDLKNKNLKLLQETNTYVESLLRMQRPESDSEG